MESWEIDERLDVARQVVRAICRDIARGVSAPGEAMPSPQVLAAERLLNPHAVESAFAMLVEAGLLSPQSGGAYRISNDAAAIARKLILEHAKTDVRDLVAELRRAGLSADEVQSVLREAGNA
jgi:DNA-binding transcriptional regulator YhcF (GntR family)